MPSSVGSSVLVFAAILTALSPVAAVIVAGVAVLWECFLFYRAGQT